MEMGVSFEVVIVIKEHFYRIMYEVQHVVSIDETESEKPFSSARFEGNFTSSLIYLVNTL